MLSAWMFVWTKHSVGLKRITSTNTLSGIVPVVYLFLKKNFITADLSVHEQFPTKNLNSRNFSIRENCCFYEQEWPKQTNKNIFFLWSIYLFQCLFKPGNCWKLILHSPIIFKTVKTPCEYVSAGLKAKVNLAFSPPVFFNTLFHSVIWMASSYTPLVLSPEILPKRK